VWVYQCSRLFSIREAIQVEELLNEFSMQWQSHGVPVKGSGLLIFGQFIILMADEEATGVSGCSTDSSVRMIKDIEQKFGVTLFERTTLAFVVKENIQLIPLSQLQYALDNGFLSAGTLYFNNLVQSREELETSWIVPLKDSWLGNKLSTTNRIA
jgi:hypothetical protein